jgi:hypothetical protein
MKNTLLALTAVSVLASQAAAGTTGKQPVATAPAPAPACNTISYDFIEAGWSRDLSGDGADGFGAAINKSLTDNLFGYADFNHFSSPDENYIGAGVGYHLPVTSCIDWVVKGGVLYSDLESTETWDGVFATGFRMSLNHWLQLDLFYNARWVDFDSVESSGSAALIFREVLAPKTDLFVLGSVGEDYEAIYAGFRYNF